MNDLNSMSEDEKRDENKQNMSNDASTRLESMGNLAHRIAALSPAKRALLELRLGENGSDASARETIPRRAACDAVPLSFAQQRLWFLNQLEPESPAYNESNAVRLSGSLDRDAFKRALKQIVLRHEVLRTTIVTLDENPWQVVASNRDVDLPVIDLRAVPNTDRDYEAQRLIVETIRKPFNLSRDLMLRVLLLQLAEQEHIFLVVKHHIASDGWSSGILWKELTALYAGFVSGELYPLPELPIQYADYAVWQRDWLQGKVLERQLSYWKKQLAGLSALELPTDRPRPSVRSYQGKRQTIELSKQLSQKLEALSRQQGATLFMTLLAAFQTLLYRYTGQEDIAVGCPIAGRTRQELEGLIGFFVNTLVMRVNFSGNPTLRELLARVREVALGAYGHQDLPFEKLVEELQPERDLTRSPLFQVAFAYQNTPNHALEITGVRVTPVEKSVETTKFDLHLSVNRAHEGLRATLQYATDLYDDVTIARLLGHFRVLLDGIVADPDRRVSELPILTEAEEHQLLIDWNDAKRDDPKDKCIHELFEQQVEKTPDAVAVVFENQPLTYRELNSRANRLAHYLQKRGVGPESLVGICVERSLEMVVGLLGILKAGGAYVPLDPAYPKERLAFMLEDTRAPLLLTQERLAEKLPALNARLVCLDRDWPQIAEEPQESAENKVNADNIAYIIYTSGTTGKPKGVMISHHNVSRLFRATEPWFHCSKDDVWTVFHSYAFDFSVWELWGALLYGGKAVIVPYWMSRSPEQFYELLCREQVTVLNQTPSAFRQLIHADQSVMNQPNLALRSIILGGEVLDFQSLQPWFDRHGDECPKLVNMYGITETTVHVTYRVVKAIDVKAGIGSLIGVPIPDLELYVLDKHRQLVPIGVPGELYVGGAGLGRGYLNRPELTAERFVLNPFSGSKTGKLYKTGDLVRRLSNGDIEYLGRTDSQVKIRGFRIELGEIEAVMSQHPAVRQATVLAREDSPGDKRVVAYVVLNEECTVVTDALRSFIKQKLPEYMVPSAFVFLAGLPLTQNGKLDRNALLAARPTLPNREETFTAARDELELQLTQIWERILRTRPIGLKDNFFDLGGHSLLAVRLISQVEKLTRQRLSLASLFQAPTIEEQARLVRREGWSPPWSSLVAIQPGGSKPPLFCVHAHDGNVLFWRELSRRLGPDQPFYGLQAHGLDGKQAPDARVEDMASRYVREIRLLQPEGPYFLGGHCLGGVIAFEMAQQLHAQGQRVALLALIDSIAPLGKPTIGRRIPLRHRVERALALTRLHIDNLRLLGWDEKFSYIEVKFNRLLYKMYMSVGTSWVLTAQARRRILDAGTEARRSYAPKVYPGSVMIFRATEMSSGREEPQGRWGTLVAGGLEVHLIPGYFSQTVYEPRVRVLAEKLTACLDRGQAGALSDEKEFARASSPS